MKTSQTKYREVVRCGGGLPPALEFDQKGKRPTRQALVARAAREYDSLLIPEKEGRVPLPPREHFDRWFRRLARMWLLYDDTELESCLATAYQIMDDLNHGGIESAEAVRSHYQRVLRWLCKKARRPPELLILDAPVTHDEDGKPLTRKDQLAGTLLNVGPSSLAENLRASADDYERDPSEYHVQPEKRLPKYWRDLASWWEEDPPRRGNQLYDLIQDENGLLELRDKKWLCDQHQGLTRENERRLASLTRGLLDPSGTLRSGGAGR